MSQKEKRTIKILLIIVASAAFIWFLGNLLLDFLSYKKSNIVMNENIELKLNDGELHFIYSHPFDDGSYYLKTKDGLNFEKVKFDLNDISYLYNDFDNNVYLLSQHAFSYYKITKKGDDIVENKIPFPLTFMFKDQNLEVFGINKDIQSNTLDVRDLKYHKKYQIEYPTYLSLMNYDDKYIYLSNDVIDQEKSVIRIISRENGEEVKTIEISSTATDLVFYKDKVVAVTDHFLHFIDKNTFDVMDISYPLSSAVGEGDKAISINNKLYVSYNNKGKVSILTLDEKYKWENTINLDINYGSGKFIDHQFFVLEQYELSEDAGGKLSVYDITEDKVTSIFLPKQDRKVQDFVLTKNN
ncbi:hypothetical protein AT864_02396 [Anoxybacillus sp. P3H1B]|jgi:hypothetical protein|uniref:hypothetical protein n=1 Tax=Anoxybacillaceae TaxID=3120669 RepID=UPI00079A581D|nr:MULTISPECIES: hypothetical protein [Anoxybacillus]KXG09442.1 hypothetical protein AT864_02396 [Anoxybacillus sp. P3H1B]MBS2771761.1 hypothetical protein [Anoxybacillus rupiensis]